MAVDVIEVSVARTFQNSGSLSPKRKEKCGRKWETIPRIDKTLGYKSRVVRRSEVETLEPDYIQHIVKHPSKQIHDQAMSAPKLPRSFLTSTPMGGHSAPKTDLASLHDGTRVRTHDTPATNSGL
ncbi:hypothetical protein TNCV_92621 [Trichonephila clavipes]|nr:hypothetical protein TNCV_92621 [Trichonephila clavipes]